jgi:hypothetical protein
MEGFMADFYNPQNWYWIVNGSTTEVFSSKSGTFVPVANPDYVAWLANDNRPTRIASRAELGEVLAPFQVRPADPDVLDGYQDAHSRKITIEVVAKLLFAMTNEVRTLKGQSVLSAGQFRAYVKGLM